jgi:aryl-alcohol dehydrogenase-like predicted oxidoreductase
MMTAENQVDAREWGSTGLKVLPVALGCMGMSGVYGGADENESMATISRGAGRGGDAARYGRFYGAGHNEMLIGRALSRNPLANLLIPRRAGSSPARDKSRPPKGLSFLILVTGRPGANAAQNERVAAALEITPAQFAVAWVLAKGRRIIPVIGACTRQQLSESLAAV